ncbi:MAG: FHA domain-containing protein [Geitlerinemataceae cyanobacterium]
MLPVVLNPITDVITLSLLHPHQAIPVKSWTFENESAIRIGRSTDNHVVLYSAVVSRYHMEVRQQGDTWKIVNLGSNGTYCNDKPIAQMVVVDGTIVRLARSGPQIKIHIDADSPKIPTPDPQIGQKLLQISTPTLNEELTEDLTLPNTDILPSRKEDNS